MQLFAQLLLASRVHRKLMAALTSVGATFIARIGGFELAIGREQLTFDEAKRAQQLHHDGQGLMDHLVTDAVAEVTEVILAGDMVVQAGQRPVVAPLVRLVQIAAEAGIVDVLIHAGGHLQHHQAGRIVAGATSDAIVRRTDRAGEAEVNGGANEPTEAALDVALARQHNGTRGERIVREPPAGHLGESRREGLAVVLVEGFGLGHKRLKVKGRELFVGKGEHVSAHSSSSSS